jgi:rod shape-determining protein MreD
VRALVSFVSFAVAAVAVVVQVTIVDRIAFPGGAGPDLVLLTVAALALAGGPLIGALTGFWAGLALDVAPPGSHFAGQNALVFCLVGYACGLLADESSPDADQGHTALFEILVTAAGAVCGEALAALLGVMLSDPRVTWPAVTRVLPVAIAYDVLLCPFVLYAVAATLRLAGARGEDRRAGWTASQVRDPAPAANQGAIRQLAAGSGPRLRLSERDKGSGPAGRHGPGIAWREPQLKLGRPAQRTATAAFAVGGLSAGSSKVRFGGRRRGGMLGGSPLGGANATGSALRGSGLGSSRFGSSTMGRSLFGGSVFRRSSAPLGATSRFGRSAVFGRPVPLGRRVPLGRPAPLGRRAPLGLSSPFRRRNTLIRVDGGLAGSAPRFSRGGSFARFTAVLRRSAGPKSPGRGWLRGASARSGSSVRGRSPSRTSLRGTSLRGTSLRGTSLRGTSLRGTSLSGRSPRGRSLRGNALRGTPLRGSSPRRGSLGGRSVRLRMPRPKVKRRRRRGGYR